MGVEAAGDRALSPRVLEQAADWLMRLHEDGNAVQRAQWQRWHDADPEHARAWQRAERLLALSGQVPPALAHGALQRPASPGRRAVLRSVAALLVAPLGGWLAWRLYDDAAWDASVRTAVGERLRRVLDDGSVLHLATASAVDIAFDGQQRLLRLRRGEIHIDTAPDPHRPARPLRVATPHGMLQALGTRFNVRLFDDATLLVVQQGAVQVTTAAGATQRVAAGQQLRWGTPAWPHRRPLRLGATRGCTACWWPTACRCRRCCMNWAATTGAGCGWMTPWRPCRCPAHSRWMTCRAACRCWPPPIRCASIRA